jgi:hypothetical protein
MIRLLVMLADLNPADVLKQQKPPGLTNLPYTVVILGAVTAMAVVGSVVILAFRRKFKRRHHRHHHQPDQPAAVNAATPSAASPAATDRSERKRRGRRHRRRTHRPINPTLAETGGLPPMRDPNTPPPGL